MMEEKSSNSKTLYKPLTLLFIFLINIGLAQTVVNVIPAPRNAFGLCWDGANLWCGRYAGGGDTIYKLNPANGTILKKIRWRANVACYGLAFETAENGRLWVGTQITGPDSIFYIDTITGARIRAIRSYKEYMAGLANDGQYLWHCVYSNPDGRVYHINKTTGAVFDSINIPTLPQPWSATWDGEYLWVGNDGAYGGEHRIYKIDVNLKQIVDSINSPGPNPYGLAWDGRFLWVLATGTSPSGRVVYQVDLGGAGTPDISVLPTSYNYGDVEINTTASFRLRIANFGTDTLKVYNVYSQNPVFTYQGSSFPRNIPPDESINLSVSFTPPAFETYQANLVITCNDPDEETVLVSLRGRGVYMPPTLYPSENTYNFQDVRLNGITNWFLKITNRGYATLRIDSINYTDSRFYNPAINLPLYLNFLESTYVEVITRVTSLGLYNGDMKIYSNSTPNPYVIPLYANGVPNNYVGGQLIWQYEFPVNVVCVSPVADITGDDVVELAAESYGTGTTTGYKHLRLFYGNSSGSGVVRWQVGDAGFTGSWGDDCLICEDDYNGDGILDIVLGTAWGDRSVYAINSLNGQIIWQYDSYSYDGDGGWVYSVKSMPDINGDGIGEVLAGIGGNSTAGGGPRSMYCFSGANGNIIWQFRIQDAVGTVDWIPDVNNDGVIDAICGGWGNSYDKRVYCVSGASSGLVVTPIWQFQCPSDVNSVIAIPDINGDNKWDVVAGDWSGVVRCLSGATGTQIWSTSLGSWVLKLVPIPDLIQDDRPGIAVVRASAVSEFIVLNCLNGNIYWTFPIGSNTWSADAIKDMNGDRKDDVLVGNQTPGTVYCLSGADGSIIWSYYVGRLIYSVRAIPDISFDGRADVLVGTQASSGKAKLLALCGGGVSSVEERSSLSANRLPLKVYPNPAQNYFTICLPQSADRSTIKLFDVSGKCLKQITVKGEKIVSLKGISPGVYFLKYNDPAYKSQVTKLVVLK